MKLRINKTAGHRYYITVLSDKMTIFSGQCNSARGTYNYAESLAHKAKPGQWFCCVTPSSVLYQSLVACFVRFGHFASELNEMSVHT